MTADSFGKNQYISVRGLDKALKLIKYLAEINPEHQFLLQLDDSDVWIVSWAARDFKFGGERFVHMTDFEYDDYVTMVDSAREKMTNLLEGGK